MNDVLPKPFTKESMNRVLCKHLPPGVSKPDDASTPQPLAPPPIPQAAMAQAQRVSGPPYVTSTSGQSPLHLNMASLGPGANIKDEPSPMGKSPANSGGWTPTGQIPSASPIGPVQGGFVQAGMRDPSMYSITPTHPHNPAYPSPLSMAGGPRGPPMRRSMTDISGPGVDGTNEHPEKRQRVYQR